MEESGRGRADVFIEESSRTDKTPVRFVWTATLELDSRWIVATKLYAMIQIKGGYEDANLPG